MIIAHYAHRLPADYDIAIIRTRAKARGPVWDAIAGLHFKDFVLRECGRLGAIANEYSSLYLSGSRTRPSAPRSKPTLRSMRATGRARSPFRVNNTTFDADLTRAFAAEIERNREIASQPGMVAAAVGLDPESWKFTRILVSEHEPAGRDHPTAYEVPLLPNRCWANCQPPIT